MNKFLSKAMQKISSDNGDIKENIAALDKINNKTTSEFSIEYNYLHTVYDLMKIADQYIYEDGYQDRKYWATKYLYNYIDDYSNVLLYSDRGYDVTATMNLLYIQSTYNSGTYLLFNIENVLFLYDAEENTIMFLDKWNLQYCFKDYIDTFSNMEHNSYRYIVAESKHKSFGIKDVVLKYYNEYSIDDVKNLLEECSKDILMKEVEEDYLGFDYSLVWTSHYNVEIKSSSNGSVVYMSHSESIRYLKEQMLD